MPFLIKDNQFKDMDSNIKKMQLDELITENHSIKKAGDKKHEISDVYGIVYRIYCIPEKKSYVGQTLSHGYVGKYLNKKGILSRVKQHYNDRILEAHKNKPLYIALAKYDANQFEVFEEEKIVGKDLAFINQKEGEYMKKYNSLHPNGYNIEEVGKKYPKILKDLEEHHKFKMQKHTYIDTTRSKRKKDVCVGTYFKLKKQQHLGEDKTLELLKTISIENVTLVDSKGLRIIVAVKDEKVNIRIYFSGSKENCVKYAKKIYKNVVITPSFIGKECYKYQLKLDKVLEDSEIITTITGSSYHNSARNCDTYLIMISGKKNGRIQTLHRISFGGLTMKIEDTYKIALEFSEKIKKYIDNSSVNYILKSP